MSIPLPPALLVLDYSLLFMFFSFARGGQGLVYIGAALDYFPRGWAGESCVECDAHLFCSFTQATLGLVGGRNGSLLSVWHSVRKLSMGWESRMSQSLFLVVSLSSACWENKIY
jgi:hypothetical protein